MYFSERICSTTFAVTVVSLLPAVSSWLLCSGSKGARQPLWGLLLFLLVITRPLLQGIEF